MPTKRKPAEVAAQRREDIARARPHPEDSKPAQLPARMITRSEAATAPESLTTSKDDGPVWGSVIPVPPAADYIAFSSTASGACSIELRAAMDDAVDWESESLTAPSMRPQVSHLAGYTDRAIPDDVPKEVTNRTVRRASGAPPAPRWPAYVRVRFATEKQRPMTITYAVEFRFPAPPVQSDRTPRRFDSDAYALQLG